MNFSEGRRYLLALLSGALLALSFPQPGLSVLAWFALVPLLCAARAARPGLAFKLGFAGGLVGYGILLYWINIVLTGYGRLALVTSISLHLVLAGYLALYLGLALWLTRLGEERGVPALCSLPLLWVALELARNYLLTGFPWASLGYSQYRTLPLIQIADLTGVYGVSYLVAFANVVCFEMWCWFRRRGSRYPVRGVLALFLLLAATLGYGLATLNRVGNGTTQRVLLVQGNIPQERKWDPRLQEATVATYERLSRQGCRSEDTLVIWPESALPFFLEAEPVYRARVAALAAELKSCLVTGSPALERRGGTTRILNSAFLVSPAGTFQGRSDKLHLVPFGEYVPLGSRFPFLSRLVAGSEDFTPGTRALPLESSGGKIGVLVCFEGIFPEIARQYVQAGAGLLVNITNDAWFGRSSAPYQLLSMTVFRAVENRVPLVRAANTGFSSVIDSRGHIRGMTELFQEATLGAQVRRGEGGSFYTRHGDLFAWLCLAGCAGLAGLGFVRRRPAPAGAIAPASPLRPPRPPGEGQG